MLYSVSSTSFHLFHIHVLVLFLPLISTSYVVVVIKNINIIVPPGGADFGQCGWELFHEKI